MADDIEFVKGLIVKALKVSAAQAKAADTDTGEV